MDEQGWIKVNRKLLNWEWYKETNTKSLFIHALLRANFDDQKFQGIIVPRGSFVSSYPNLAAETGLSVQNVRTALKRLISTGELTVKKYPKFTLFKVENYDMYQTPNSQTNSQLTVNQQAPNSQLTTIKEIKNIRSKEIKNNKGRFSVKTEIESLEIGQDLKDALLAFAEMRKQMKAPIGTQRTLTLLLNSLEKLGNNEQEKTAIVNQSIERGWKSFYEIKTPFYQQKPVNQGLPDWYAQTDSKPVDPAVLEKALEAQRKASEGREK